MEFIVDRMTAVVSGATVTLTPIAVGSQRPDYLAISAAVLTTVAAAAPPDFWKSNSVDGSEYELIIQRKTKM
jgi:hypothetical protein